MSSSLFADWLGTHKSSVIALTSFLDAEWITRRPHRGQLRYAFIRYIINEKYSINIYIIYNIMQ